MQTKVTSLVKEKEHCKILKIVCLFKLVVEDTFVTLIVTLNLSMEIRSPIIKRREYVALSGELMLENCRLALR